MQAEIDRWREWIGRQETSVDQVTPELARRFYATFDIYDVQVDTGDPAPQLIHFCLAQPAAATATLGDDGHPTRGGFLPPVSLPQRMWAGSELHFHDELLVGDLVTRISTIADVVMKEGRSGRLCFVTVDHALSTEAGLVTTERQTLVYRDPAHENSGPAAPETSAAGAHVRTIEASPPLLFRYSALTFNGHRIHYDLPYATEIERYPGLVVHGPLQATLLILLAERVRGVRPTHFSFSGRAPAFGGRRLALHAQEDGARLWTVRDDGAISMTAEARWA